MDHIFFLGVSESFPGGFAGSSLCPNPGRRASRLTQRGNCPARPSWRMASGKVEVHFPIEGKTVIGKAGLHLRQSGQRSWSLPDHSFIETGRSAAGGGNGTETKRQLVREKENGATRLRFVLQPVDRAHPDSGIGPAPEFGVGEDADPGVEARAHRHHLNPDEHECLVTDAGAPVDSAALNEGGRGGRLL